MISRELILVGIYLGSTFDARLSMYKISATWVSESKVRTRISPLKGGRPPLFSEKYDLVTLSWVATREIVTSPKM